MPRTLWFTIVAGLLFLTVGLVRSEANFDSTTRTTGIFTGCPPEGEGGDPDLNSLKNRDLPPDNYQAMKLSNLINLRLSAVQKMGAKYRRNWSVEVREKVAEQENQGISLCGYLLSVKQEQPEGCNCHDDTKRDFHLVIAESPNDLPAKGVIVEISPRLLEKHPNWRLRILSRLAKDKALIKVSGWLMWDGEHPRLVGKSRATLWEVHPIHQLEVWSGGAWRTL